MSIFPIQKVLALRALKLMKKGMKGKAISLELKNGISTDDANLLAAVGHSFEVEEHNTLTDREKSVLLALADIIRNDRVQGITASPKAKHVAWRLRISDAKLRTAAKRLSVPVCSRNYGHFGFLEHSINGHIWLKPSGWAMVHVLEAAQEPAYV